MHECMLMFYMPALDSIQLQFTLNRRCSPSQARTILQLSFCDDEGQLWLLPPGRYRAFGLNATLMAASTDLIL
jgi:hypothetical protein